ncbi:type II toxin-antitoxin system antitoxin SocA domain-containing protein [Pseudocolwellia sp. AS88]|uniref:Panacea domain-containing protein n=1 Tax=Pseudocolwellia TaxID=2848177 RepID=UPI0026EE57E3|nr:type II toxin-antitoxin system antitoxin SocA domain-containing protein [Pseudocolwellia sp. AS88]MDO7083581.1 DUF4065 domain-containing protein [Pseudocolwellia sp. AS88]
MVSSSKFAQALLDRAVEKSIMMSPLKLQKLAYYCQGYFLATHSKRLFEDDINAWKHGPVVDVLYHEFKQHGSTNIPHKQGDTFLGLNEENQKMIDYVLDNLGQLGGWNLRNKTHNESPWVDTYLKGEGEGRVITDKLMTDYFSQELSLLQDEQLANILDCNDRFKDKKVVIELPDNVESEDDFVTWVNSL